MSRVQGIYTLTNQLSYPCFPREEKAQSAEGVGSIHSNGPRREMSQAPSSVTMRKKVNTGSQPRKARFRAV